MIAHCGTYTHLIVAMRRRDATKTLYTNTLEVTLASTV